MALFFDNSGKMGMQRTLHCLLHALLRRSPHNVRVLRACGCERLLSCVVVLLRAAKEGGERVAFLFGEGQVWLLVSCLLVVLLVCAVLVGFWVLENCPQLHLSLGRFVCFLFRLVRFVYIPCVAFGLFPLWSHGVPAGPHRYPPYGLV
jgi:hypothetical protein